MKVNSGPVNWWEVYRQVLWRRPALTPLQVDDMTLPEMTLCCEVPGPMGEDGHKAPRGMPNMNPEENARAIKEWRELTPLQRIQKLIRDNR